MVRNEAIYHKLKSAKKAKEEIVEIQEELNSLKELIDARVRWYELLVSLDNIINSLEEYLHKTE